jgi:EmrB/QacA subfamily drug resistance transporter
MWAATFGLGVGIGPIVGGWLVESYSWNAVFFINLPIAVIALVGGYFFLPESFDKEAPKADVPGVLLSIVGLFALVFGIIEAGMSSWTDGTVLIAFGIATLFLGAFAVWESRAPNAMLPMKFFKNMSFTGANTAIALVFFGMLGSMFFFSQYFQSVQGLTAFEAGLRVLPISVFLIVAAGMSTRLSARFGIKLTVGFGILFAAAALMYFSQIIEVDTPYTLIVVGFALLGLGMGTAMTPATDSIMGSVPAVKAGIGSAMNDTTRQLGGALGVAILGTVMNSVYLSEISSLEQAPFFGQLPEQAYTAIQSSIQGAQIVAEQVPVPQIAQLITDTAGEAFVLGMTQAMFIGALITAAAALLTFAILPTRIQRADEVPDDVTEAESAQTPESTPTPLPSPSSASAD